MPGASAHAALAAHKAQATDTEHGAVIHLCGLEPRPPCTQTLLASAGHVTCAEATTLAGSRDPRTDTILHSKNLLRFFKIIDTTERTATGGSKTDDTISRLRSDPYTLGSNSRAANKIITNVHEMLA